MQDDTYNMLSAPGEGLYKEKGSKFIASAFTVMSEDEAKAAIADIRKKYFDATVVKKKFHDKNYKK